MRNNMTAMKVTAFNIHKKAENNTDPNTYFHETKCTIIHTLIFKTYTIFVSLFYQWTNSDPQMRRGNVFELLIFQPFASSRLRNNGTAELKYRDRFSAAALDTGCRFV